MGARSIQFDKKVAVEEPVSAREITPQTKLYPKQVYEINRAFERVSEQFVAHQETQTILELVRAFVISLGIERKDASKILEGIKNILARTPESQSASGESSRNV